MEAGRELDALIAKTLFGWRTEKAPSTTQPHNMGTNFYNPSGQWVEWVSDEAAPLLRISPGYHVEVYPRSIPKYSTDIAAAWAILEKLSDETRSEKTRFHFSVGKNSCELERRVYIGEPDTFYAEGDTCAHAICLAALDATIQREISHDKSSDIS